jgi:2-polyprenyl-3-methyl-5-hydroxy-6-metoxy-1,4-benzoquinol methylase
MLMPTLRRLLDQQFRYLPRPIPGSRVLDVGCGSGSFLESAMAAGWDVAGVDPDEKAVANAKARGLNVRQGSIEVYANESESFDAITLSHVIEHIHDPAAFLREVFLRLKPGGILYLETPNIESLGHQTYGLNWRGLELPRHLVIFCRKSILRVLEEAGFISIRFLTRTNEYLHMFQESSRIANHQDPYGLGSPSHDLTTRLASLRGHIYPSQQEYITLVANSGKKNENLHRHGDL